MRPESENLERLISRFLDNEATPNQRRTLDDSLARDPGARALFEDITALDREAAAALHSALDRPRLISNPRIIRLRLSNWLVAAAAAAACVAAVVLPNVLNAPNRRPTAGGPEQARAINSWIAPNAPDAGGDRFEPQSTEFLRPHQSVRDAQRDIILVPGRNPGEFMVIEVNRSRERVRFHESGI